MNTITKIGISGLLLLLLNSSTCYIGCPGDIELFLDNSSDGIVACFVASGHMTISYPDTLLPKTQPNELMTEQIKGSTCIWSRRGYDYSYFFSFTQEKVLSVFIINQEDIDNIGWEGISSQNKYLVRYDLTESDLNRLKGTLSFPPSVDMKNVKMWPRYEEVIRPYERPSRHSPITGDTYR